MESNFAFDARFGLMVFGEFYQFGLAVANLMQTPLAWSRSRPTRATAVSATTLTGRYDCQHRSIKIQPRHRFTEITSVQLDLHARAFPESVLGEASSRRCLHLVHAIFQDIRVRLRRYRVSATSWSLQHHRNHRILCHPPPRCRIRAVDLEDAFSIGTSSSATDPWQTAFSWPVLA